MNCPSQLILISPYGICITLNCPDPTALLDQGRLVNKLFHLQKYVTYHSQLPSPFFARSAIPYRTRFYGTERRRVSTTDNVEFLVIIATIRPCSDSRSISQVNVTFITAVCHVWLNCLSLHDFLTENSIFKFLMLTV